MSEQLVRTPRMKITPTNTPAPFWTGLKFECRRCHAVWQLEAGDRCDAIDGTEKGFLTPPCPTPNCGVRAVVNAPAKRSAS